MSKQETFQMQALVGQDYLGREGGPGGSSPSWRLSLLTLRWPVLVWITDLCSLGRTLHHLAQPAGQELMESPMNLNKKWKWCSPSF
jgi:hypothetical protein